MPSDLTILYYTANKADEEFTSKVREQLLLASEGKPIISISKKPMDFGYNVVEEEKKSSILNIYKVLLMGAKLVKTKWIALAEDDILYTPDHFRIELPEDSFCYNWSKWSLYQWTNFYSLKNRNTLSCLVVCRDLMIEAIEERFNKYPDPSVIPERWIAGEFGRSFEKQMGVTQRKVFNFFTYSPLIAFSRIDAMGFDNLGTKKRAGIVQAYDIPYWGHVNDVLKKYCPKKES